MSTESREKRLDALRMGLKRGDKAHIARLAGVHRVWVSYVIKGQGVSERILTIAEGFIANRSAENHTVQ